MQLFVTWRLDFNDIHTFWFLSKKTFAMRLSSHIKPTPGITVECNIEKKDRIPTIISDKVLCCGLHSDVQQLQSCFETRLHIECKWDWGHIVFIIKIMNVIIFINIDHDHQQHYGRWWHLYCQSSQKCLYFINCEVCNGFHDSKRNFWKLLLCLKLI